MKYSPNDTFPKAALDAFAETGNLRIKIESIHQEQEEDARLRRFKDKLLFIATLFLIIFLSIVLSGFIIINRDSPQVGIAINGLVALIMSLAGYYIGNYKRV